MREVMIEDGAEYSGMFGMDEVDLSYLLLLPLIAKKIDIQLRTSRQ